MAVLSRKTSSTPALHVRFFPTKKAITIVPLADLHLGAAHANRKLMREYLNYILRTPDCYTIGLGDYVENATRNSVGMGMYAENFHFPRQMELVEEMLRPLVQAGKLLGLHTGNHEMRATLATGLDPAAVLAKQLRVPYLGYTAFHKWIVGETTYHVVTLHGRSTARSPAGRLNTLRSLRDIANADVYLMGHLHDRQVHQEVVYEIDDASDSVVSRTRYYIIVGGLLEWPGSYADMLALPPVMPGLVKISLAARTKDVNIQYDARR